MKLKIEWTYKTPRNLTATFTSDFMPIGDMLLLLEDMERTGRMKNYTLIDEHDSTWLLKEVKKYLKSLEEEPHDVTLFFDGGFMRETRKSGLGFVIYYSENGKKKRIRKNALVDYLNSNNEAEYAALHLAIQELRFLGVHHQSIVIKGDSQGVINQMRGEWPLYEEALNKWADKIDALLEELGLTVHYLHVPRQQNSEADQLASQALNGVMYDGKIELT